MKDDIERLLILYSKLLKDPLVEYFFRDAFLEAVDEFIKKWEPKIEGGPNEITKN